MAHITIAGNLARDAETRFTQSGEAVTGFSIADNIQIGKEKSVQYFNCTIWGKRGESLAQYIKKGGAVTVFGEFSERKYTDKNGVERTSLEVRVNDIKLQGGKNDSNHEPQSSQRSHQAPSSAPAAPRRETRASVRPVDDIDDDFLGDTF